MEVKFHTTFKKKLKKIPPKIQDRFYERLELFMQDKFNRILNLLPPLARQQAESNSPDLKAEKISRGHQHGENILCTCGFTPLRSYSTSAL